LGLLKDADEFEKEVFGSMKYFSLITTMLKTPEHPRGEKEQCMSIWPDRLTPDAPARLYCERNEWLSLRFGTPKPAQRISIAYQFHEDYYKVDPEKAKETLQKDMELVYGEKAKEIEVLHQEVWQYFPHFKQEEINKLYPWKILDYQGTNKTWYIGSSACFESVEDVTSYNNLLIRLCLMDGAVSLKDAQASPGPSPQMSRVEAH